MINCQILKLKLQCANSELVQICTMKHQRKTFFRLESSSFERVFFYLLILRYVNLSLALCYCRGRVQLLIRCDKSCFTVCKANFNRSFTEVHAKKKYLLVRSEWVFFPKGVGKKSRVKVPFLLDFEKSIFDSFVEAATSQKDIF